MHPRHVVIVGAGLAGLRTAERLRRQGYDGDLTLLGAERHLPYDRPPLSKSFLTTGDSTEPPLLRAADRFGELDLDLRLGRRATALDPTERQVHLDDGTLLAYDALVVATGSRARTVPAWERVPGTFTLRTWDDALALRRALGTTRAAVVIGAGVLGCELAATVRARGVDVHLVDVLPRPLDRVVPPSVSGAVARLHERNGVHLHLGTAVRTLTEGPGGPRLELDDGTTLHPDLMIVAVGAVPMTDWLSGSGLSVDDGVACDSEGRTADPRIWAVGDVARHRHPDGSSTRLEHWTAAGDGAARVAARLLGNKPPTHVDVPYFWSDQYDAKIQALGLPSPGDEMHVATGDVKEGRFLAVTAREGLVTGAVAIDMPAPLARCRAAVENHEPLADLLTRAPWERKRASA